MRNVHPPTANTKRRTILFFEIGMILALSFVLWAFNYSSIVYVPNSGPSENENTEYEIEQIGEIIIEPDEVLAANTETQRNSDQYKIVPDYTYIPEPGPTPTPITPLDPNAGPKLQIDAGPQFDPGATDNTITWGASLMPAFPGGEAAMKAFISKELDYPPMAIENGIQGKVMVSFVIEKDGSISNIEILSHRLGWGIEEEAMRVVQAMPRWSPGENNFRPVRVRMNLPIRFVFQ